MPAGTGGRCCLYSISGGSGTLMAEVAESSGVPVPWMPDQPPSMATMPALWVQRTPTMPVT